MNEFEKVIKEIPEVIKKYSQEDENFKIRFIPRDNYTDSVIKEYENSEILCTPISATMIIEDKVDKSILDFEVDLLDIPTKSELGFKIGGTYKQILNVYDKAKGWYLSKGADKGDSDIAKAERDSSEVIVDTNSGKSFLREATMKLIPTTGYNFSFANSKQEGIIVKTSSKKGGTRSVGIGYFLKAITGLTYKEIQDAVGSSASLNSSLYVNGTEPSYEESIQKTADLFPSVGSSKTGSSLNLSIIKANLDRSLFDSKHLYLDEASRIRFRDSSSFSSRALNTILVEDVILKDERIVKGTILSKDILRKIDDEGINTLAVNKNGNDYILKRYPIKDNSLSVGELLTAVNMYCCLQDGFNNFDDEYSLTSRVFINYERKVLSELENNLSSLITEVTNKLNFISSGGNREDDDAVLLKILKDSPSVDSDAMLRYIRDFDATEIQLADNVNILASAVKDIKATTNYKGTAPGSMVEIQATQMKLNDPVPAPESAKIGKIHQRTVVCKVDEKTGFASAPYIRVINGKPDTSENKIVYLTARESQYAYIAEWNETFENKLINVFYDGVVIKVPKENVQYMGYSPYDEMSISRAFLPFQNHMNCKRSLMACNHMTQAVDIMYSERPLVSTGSELFMDLGVITAHDILDEDYELTSFGDNKINTSKGVLTVSKEKYREFPIKLVNTEISRGLRKLSLEVMCGDCTRTINKNIVFMQKTEKTTTITSRINPKDGLIYQGDDVVAYNSNADIKKYNKEMFADFGHMNADVSKLNFGLQLGINLKVALMNYWSSSIDDSIAIREGLVYGNKLTTCIQKEYSTEYRKQTDSFEEVPGFPNSLDRYKLEYDYFQDNGLPKVGTFLKPGDIVIAKFKRVITKNKNGQESIRIIDQNIKLKNNQYGQVISAEKIGDKATVKIANLACIEVGDKMAGRYGNKGVVGIIVPDAWMPYDEETGEPVDVCLNELGLPSRMNMGQVLEITLAEVMKRQGKIAIVTPYKPDMFDKITDLAEENGVKPRMLIDGRTGTRLKRPVNVGYQYMLKLEHMVNKKIHSINFPTGINPTTGQPLSGAKSEGGQAVGEYETWCLLASNCKKVLQDLFSIQSDDLEGKENLAKLINGNPNDISLEGNNDNDKIQQMICRCYDTDIYVEDGCYIFKPLTDKAIRQLSDKPVNCEDKESLYNPVIFGKTKPNDVSIQENKGKWSWVDLHCKIIHPNWIIKGDLRKLIIVEEIKKKNSNSSYEDFDDISESVEIETKLNTLTKKVMEDIINGHRYVKIDGDKIQVSFLDKVEDGFETGMKSLVKIFETYDLDKTVKYYEGQLENYEEGDKIYNDYIKVLATAKDWINSGMTLKDYVISTYPVAPLVFRPKTSAGNRVHPMNYYYERILTAIRLVKNNYSNENVVGVYNAIANFIGYAGTESLKDDAKHPPLSVTYLGKHKRDKGMLRTDVLSKRVFMSGRSVIIPSQDSSMTVEHIGLPILMAFEIYKPFLVSLFKKAFLGSNNDCKFSYKFYTEMLDYIASNSKHKFTRLFKSNIKDDNIFYLNNVSYDVNDETDMEELFYVVKEKSIEFIEHRVVLFGRQPSLHKFAVRAYRPKVVNTKALQLNPLVCKGYNADFDGDQMYLIALVTNEACEEAMEKLSPVDGVINPKDSSNIIELTQDMILGIYNATMLYDNAASIYDNEKYKNIYAVESVEQLESLVDTDNIKYQDLVTVTVDGRNYISTAGRIIVNSMLPSAFTDKPFSNPLNLPIVESERPKDYNIDNTIGIKEIKPSRYYDLKYDALLSAKGKSSDGVKYLSINSITSKLFYEVGHKKCMEVFQKLMMFGFKACSFSGMTINMSDLKLNVDLKPYIEKAEKYGDLINQYYNDGLLTPQGKKNALISLYKNLTEYLEKKVVFNNIDRNNNLFIILDSGARGSIGQMMQTLGIVGVSMKNSSESLETPILHSYGASGLSSFENFLASYGARMGVYATQLETPDAGYATRETIFMTGGIQIVEDDCGNTDTEVELLKEGLIAVVKPDGSEVFKTKDNNPLYDLIGKKLSDNNSILVKEVVRNFLNVSGRLNEESLIMLTKQKVDKLVCFDENGNEETYKLKYELSPTVKDDLLWRELDEDIPELNLKKGKFLDKSDIEGINKLSLPRLKVRTMLTCKSKNGVCAHCYGLKFDTLELPEVGENVGIVAAQAIGEPAAQLSMSLFHKGGVTGGASGGIAFYQQALRASIPSKTPEAIIAQNDGHVSIQKNGKLVSLVHGFIKTFVNADMLLVRDGEYVQMGDKLTAGNIQIDKIGEQELSVHLSKSMNSFDSQDINAINSIINKRKWTMLDIYYQTFAASDISIHARHFELLTKVQTSLVTVVESDDPRYSVGKLYEMCEIQKSMEEGHNIKYSFNMSKQEDVVSHFTGGTSVMCFERYDERLARLTIKQTKSNFNSSLAKLSIGEDVRDIKDESNNLVMNERKKLNHGDAIYIEEDDDDDSDDNNWNVIDEVSIDKVDMKDSDIFSDNSNNEEANPDLFDDSLFNFDFEFNDEDENSINETANTEEKTESDNLQNTEDDTHKDNEDINLSKLSMF